MGFLFFVLLINNMSYYQGGGYGQQQVGYPPQQGGYGAPQQGGYGQQQGGYPPQQGGYGAPQQGYGAPQQGGYGGYAAPGSQQNPVKASSTTSSAPHGSNLKQQNAGNASVYYNLGQRVGLTPQEVDTAVNHFHTCDTDGSGSVDCNELERMLNYLLGHKMKPLLINRLAKMHFQEADRDKSGAIDIQEFLEIYAKLKKAH